MEFISSLFVQKFRHLANNITGWKLRRKAKDTETQDRGSYIQVNVWKPETFIFLSFVVSEYIHISRTCKELQIAMECLDDWQISSVLNCKTKVCFSLGQIWEETWIRSKQNISLQIICDNFCLYKTLTFLTIIF